MSNLASPLGNDFPADWKLVQFRSITRKIGSGATPRGGKEVYLPNRENFALVRSQNVYDGRFDESGLAFISDAHAQQLQNAWLQSEDILLNITGDGATFGRSCLVPDHIFPACVNQHTAIIRVEKEHCVPGFILAYLLHPKVKQYIEELNVGGSRRAITKGHIEGFVIALPPLAEQRKIAQILSTWDEAIALVEALIAALKRRKQGLMQRLLTGEVRFPGFDDEWEVMGFGEFAERNKERFDPRNSNEILPCIELEHIAQSTGQIIGRTTTKDQLSIKNRFSAGQVLFGKLRPYLEKYAQPDFDGVCSSEIWVLTGKNGKCLNEFLFYFIQSRQFIGAANVSSGSKMPRAEWSFVAEQPFSIPNSLDEQRAIADALNAFDTMSKLYMRQVSNLREQKRGLLQRLLTGEVRVRGE